MGKRKNRKEGARKQDPKTKTRRTTLYYDLMGDAIDDEADKEESRRERAKRRLDFKNGGFGLTGVPTIGTGDSDSD